MLRNSDRVWCTSETNGTDDIVVSGVAAADGFLAFSEIPGLAVNDELWIGFVHRAENEFEMVKVKWLGANTLRRVEIYSSSNGGAAVSFSAGTKDAFCALPQAEVSNLRQPLTADRTLYVRAIVGAPAFTNASSNITLAAHGLAVGDPVVFSILPNTKTVTISQANPAVATTTAPHGYSAGQPVKFWTTGYMGPGVNRTSTYYVLASGLTATDFQFSTTPGGAAVDNSLATLTAASGTGGALQITASKAHLVSAGMRVAFANSGGALPGNLAANTVYHVAASPAPTSTVFYVSTTNGGTNVAYSSAGSGTNTIVPVGQDAANIDTTTFSTAASHQVDSAGNMPGGAVISAGTVYYVASVIDANTFTISSTPGGATYGPFTVATGAPVYSMATGNDANDGSAQTRASALLTVQAAISKAASEIDLAGYRLTIKPADGVYLNRVEIPVLVGQASIDDFYLEGNATTWKNVQLYNPNSAEHLIAADNTGGKISLKGLQLRAQTSGNAIHAVGAGSTIKFGSIDFLAAQYQVNAEAGGFVFTVGRFSISASVISHAVAIGGRVKYSTFEGAKYTLYNVPNFSLIFADCEDQANMILTAAWAGSSRGARYFAANYGVINTNGGGANFLPGNAAGSVSNGLYV